jgi:SAM-dependent methyltransferase
VTYQNESALSASSSSYMLSNSGDEALDRFEALSALFDAETIRHLEARGVTEGWRCLEVGGGGGSVTRWLADRVGPTGSVLVTDIDPRFLIGLAASNVEIRHHDIATDPLPEAAFDLIHVRLVLIHVPQRERVLARLVTALKPGGWLVEEEYDSASLLPDPSVYPGEVILDTQQATMRLLESRGVERRWGRMLFEHLRTLGLRDIHAEARMSMWQGGSPGASLMKANFKQLRADLVDAGYITQQQFEKDIALLSDAAFVAPSPLMWTAWGRRPSFA